MILSDKEILTQIKQGKIIIDPFREDCLGSNSYDVHLSQYLAIYKNPILDAKKENELIELIIGEEGYILQPGELYLGSTVEYTETHDFVPFLEGKSSVGRLGIDIHATAGKGDVGFCNHWTLEISVTRPVRVYAGMPIGQIIYFRVYGEVINPYHTKSNAKYRTKNPKPVGSMMFKNKF